MLRHTRSVDNADDDPDDYLRLDEQSRQTSALRRQPPPPPHSTTSRFNRPPPPLPREAQEDESKPQTIINLNELEKGAELGQGEFGSVLRGVWTNPNGPAVSTFLFVSMRIVQYYYEIYQMVLLLNP